VAPDLLRALRATGADLPFGDVEGLHPGVRLESTFWRILEPVSRRVVIAGATVCRDAGGTAWVASFLATGGPRGDRLVAEAAFDGVVASQDRPVLRAGNGALDAGPDHLRLRAGPRAWLELEWTGARRWPRSAFGGLGLAHALPGLSQYWHPHLLGGHVRGRAALGGRPVSLDGALVYGEKSWGRGGTPPRWWWGQGFFGEEATVCFAGGVLEVGPATPSATALVVAVGNDVLRAVAPFALVRLDAEPGRWALDARAAGWSATLRGTSEGEALALPVPVPAERRTALTTHQHQHGRLELEVRRGRRVAFSGVATLAGLELGRRAT
jgi:hypothetical protein